MKKYFYGPEMFLSHHFVRHKNVTYFEIERIAVIQQSRHFITLKHESTYSAKIWNQPTEPKIMGIIGNKNIVFLTLSKNIHCDLSWNCLIEEALM